MPGPGDGPLRTEQHELHALSTLVTKNFRETQLKTDGHATGDPLHIHGLRRPCAGGKVFMLGRKCEKLQFRANSLRRFHPRTGQVERIAQGVFVFFPEGAANKKSTVSSFLLQPLEQGGGGVCKLF